MEAIRILEKPETLNWEYDEEADVLYISVGETRRALGLDIGEGVIIRYDETANEVTGLTVVGLRERLIHSLERKSTKHLA